MTTTSSSRRAPARRWRRRRREVDADPSDRPRSEHAEVAGFERGNLMLVLLVIQAVQVLLLSVAVFVFFMRVRLAGDGRR